ncbi:MULTISPECIES: TadE/TadG family type IV pilus assembly protein [unclassified Ruegeria]|uniref:TadE/TadG family type IV pilus assembly protein n=1 Tax=unclassified Ruegeria TaxID=2625375 RepID=UPI00148873B3|nr:TadE/TadG family type IV pilus assembly protein [Ruegeria sp. HKCCD8929]
MIRRVANFLRRFRRNESGNIVVEFVIVFPIVMVTALSGIELGFVALNHAMLERAVDLTVRDIRIGTGTAFTHDAIKDTVCVRAAFIPNCDANLKLEMIQLDPFAGVALPADPDCTDKSEEVRPVRSFANGQSNELMVLRACAKISPVFPTSALGRRLGDNADGQYALTATTVFVQEPR